jgi:hypothetical protein
MHVPDACAQAKLIILLLLQYKADPSKNLQYPDSGVCPPHLKRSTRVLNMPDRAPTISVSCAKTLAQSLYDNPVPKYKMTQQSAMKHCIALLAGDVPITSMSVPLSAVLGVCVETVSIPTTTRQLYADLLGSGKYSDVVFETQVCMAITFPGHNSIN